MDSYKVEIDKEFSKEVRDTILKILVLEQMKHDGEAKNKYEKLISDVESKGRVSLDRMASAELAILEKRYQPEVPEEKEKPEELDKDK